MPNNNTNNNTNNNKKPPTPLTSFFARECFHLKLWSAKYGSLKDPTAPFKTYRALIMHNVNGLMVLTEVSLMGGLPIRLLR